MAMMHMGTSKQMRAATMAGMRRTGATKRATVMRGFTHGDHDQAAWTVPWQVGESNPMEAWPFSGHFNGAWP